MKKLKFIIAMIPFMVASSCDMIWDDNKDCGVLLEFIFDYNMEYSDSFETHVGNVDVFVFDADGIFLFSKYSATGDMDGRKRMFLGDDELPAGDYKVLTVGGLNEYFEFADINHNELVPGETTLAEVQLALLYNDEVAHEFPHLYFSDVVDIHSRADMSIWPIKLVRLTNRFHLSVRRSVSVNQKGSRAPVEDALYTFEIVTPEAGVYNYRSRPVDTRTLTHHPYAISSDVEEETEDEKLVVVHTTAANINTMRLIEDHRNLRGGYRLTVRNSETGQELWGDDLLTLLGSTTPNTNAGVRPKTLQEYLDREGEWHVIVVHNGTATEGFTALKVYVNGWIVWESGVGIGGN